MSFSAKQVIALKRNLSERHIRTREAQGRQLSYIEGWFAISEANRIFGFDGWSRETIDTRCILARENRGTFIALYIAKVRIIVQSDSSTIIREGHGTGEGRGSSPGDVHDIALKAAETDATKRALATFGRPFGLELYRQSRIADQEQVQKKHIIPPTGLGFPTDDTTEIPRHSRCYRQREDPKIETGRPALATTAPSVAPTAPQGIDKSALTLSEPKRRRDKSHLRFVAAQPCSVCGRQPSDPHHLRFAQPRALGVKVSDEFTVPLCRGHHRQLHQAGNEIAWWDKIKIDALGVARKFWEETHPDEATGGDQTGASSKTE